MERFPGLWLSLDIRYSATHVVDEWYNLLTDILLSPASCEPEQAARLVDLPRLWAGSAQVPFSRLGGLLDEIGQGALQLGDRKILLSQPARPADGRPDAYRLAPFFHTLKPSEGWKPFWDKERASAGFELQAHGGSLSDLISHDEVTIMERQLLSHSPPYFGLEDLFRFFLRSNAPGTQGGGQFSVRAPLYTWIDSIDLDGSTLRILAHHPPSLDPQELRVVARGGTSDDIVRIDLRPETTEAARPDTSRFSVPVADLAWIQGALIIRDIRVDDFVYSLPLAHSPNPRYEALYITDQGENRLRDFVNGNPSVMRFESAQVVGLTWLLQLCGFQVIPTDLPGLKMGSSPDILAFTPLSAGVLVIEATSRDLAADGKLVKLHDRVEALRDRLPDHDVVGVAVTAKSSVTQHEAELATGLGIRVVTQTDLEGLRSSAEQNVLTSKVFESIRTIRPRTAES